MTEHEPNSTSERTHIVVGADVGGTFTDIVLTAGDGTLARYKLSSTPPQFEEAIVEGTDRVLAIAGLDNSALDWLVHGTTAATNAILEAQGAPTALVTTAGFRDVLELARMRRPSLFDPSWQKPPPLVPRHRRYEVGGRIDAAGAEVSPLAEEDVHQVIEELRVADAEAVAVCLVNSYLSPAHEQRVAELLREALPDLNVSASVEVLPEIREYERTSTTVINAYLEPLMNRYIDSLESRLRASGIDPSVLIMQSNGGLLAAEVAKRRPVYLIESGPAAGVTAATFVAEQLSMPNTLAFDMGGTTAKATLIEEGKAFEALDYEVGAGMNTNRLLRGGGYAVQVPSIDITEVGAGGGSLFWIDEAGAPRVGPRSAGAVPGPACYGRGGTGCTVTDANMVLGYLNPDQIAGGTQSVDRELAVQAVQEHVAEPLGADLLEAAHGVYRLANSNMSKAVRGVSMERGRDPRDFSLMAFGGAGPMHAVALAAEFQMPRVVVPNAPGLFSAVGLLAADLRYDYVTSYGKGAEVDAELIDRSFSQMEEHGRAALAAQDLDPAQATFQRTMDLRYQGQSFELRVPVPGTTAFDNEVFQRVRKDFDAEHDRTYGHQVPEQSVEIVNLRLRARYVDESRVETLRTALQSQAKVVSDAPTLSRPAYFGAEHGSITTPVITREHLDRGGTSGPLLVEEMDATTVVPPGWSAYRDEHGNMVIEPE